jgi:folylpolyglutamate synthase/dihydropteroate synthase
MVDSDALNANIALLGLHLLQKHHPAAFPQLDLRGEATARGLDSRPPCRWEEHVYQLPTAGTSTDASATAGASTEPAQVDVVLDMGHNPAALGALARRVAHKFPGRNVQ